MRVLCIDVIDPATGRGRIMPSSIHRDGEYEVLEIYAEPGRHVYLRVEADDDAAPVLFDSSCFLVTDARIPPGWEARLEERGHLAIGPPEWLEPGFWEAYFDGDPVAVAAYERGRARGAADD